MKLRGSALVFSLVVLSFLLMSALSVATISVTNKRSILASKNSTISFQFADTVAENILTKIYKIHDSVAGPHYADLDALAGALTGAACDNSVITGTGYAVTFYSCADADTCSDITCSSNTWRADVSKMKILGTFGGVTRAIEVGITPATTP
ncbi:MAG: hypothetical protein PHH40_00180 [Candidatus Moranbacteria bacterium]|nr:hypothetical protein [Candidatus Moranbacteria bacterium]MDD3965288.1 hypothetical protein [Candidatus Moranbacteria bacterium]